MARKRNTRRAGVAKVVKDVVEVVNMSEADQDTVTGSDTDLTEVVIEAVVPVVVSAVVVPGDAIATQPPVIGDKLADVTGVDLTEMIPFNPLTCTPEELGAYKQRQVDGIAE